MHTLVVWIAKYAIVVPIIVWLWVLVRLPNRQKVDFVIVSVVGGVVAWLLAGLGHNLIHDPRPFLREGRRPLFQSSTDNGFPSDHALLSFFLAFVIARWRWATGLILVAVALLIGWARVYSNVHHGADILGSAVIAAIGFFIGWGVGQLSSRRHSLPDKA